MPEAITTKSPKGPKSPPKRAPPISPTTPDSKRFRLGFLTPSKKPPLSPGPNIGETTPVKSPNTSVKSQGGSNNGPQFTPKKQNRLGTFNSPRKALTFAIDQEKTYEMIENFNQVNQGTIKPNEFNLEKIYSTNNFIFEYGQLDTTAAENYDIKDVVLPKEKHADHLFMAVVDVFHNVINCGYFDKKEIDTLFSLFTLSAGAQILLAKMLKRQRVLHRVEKIQRLDEGLKKHFPELIQRSFFSTGKN